MVFQQSWLGIFFSSVFMDCLWSPEVVSHINWWRCWNIWLSNWENSCAVISLVADTCSISRTTFYRSEGIVWKDRTEMTWIDNLYVVMLRNVNILSLFSHPLIASSDDMTLTSPSMDNSSAELIPGGDSPLNKRMTENLLASLLEHEREAILNVPAAQNPEDLRMFAR